MASRDLDEGIRPEFAPPRDSRRGALRNGVGQFRRVQP
jgi:hypothetical protein